MLVTTVAALRYDDDDGRLNGRARIYVSAQLAVDYRDVQQKGEPYVPQAVDQDSHRHSLLFGQACARIIHFWKGGAIGKRGQR